MIVSKEIFTTHQLAQKIESSPQSVQATSIQVAISDPNTPYGCYVCGGIEDEDLILLCDGNNCKREVHMFCLWPALYKVPEGDWLCDLCDPKGSSIYLQQHLESVEKTRKTVTPQTAEDYKLYIANNVVPWSEWSPVLFPLPPQEDQQGEHEQVEQLSLQQIKGEFDPQAADLIGCKLRVYSRPDQRYHTGRILGRRKDDQLGRIEHFVLFKRYVIA
jgi:hypothetical protein